MHPVWQTVFACLPRERNKRRAFVGCPTRLEDKGSCRSSFLEAVSRLHVHGMDLKMGFNYFSLRVADIKTRARVNRAITCAMPCY